MGSAPGSSHRSRVSILRLREDYPNAVLVHTPVHASWLNQIGIYFSTVHRKVLTTNEFDSLVKVETRLLAFQDYYERIATPFEWKFTKRRPQANHGDGRQRPSGKRGLKNNTSPNL